MRITGFAPRLRFSALGPVLGALVAGLAAGGRAAAPAQSPPNILIILADDMGYSDPGFMGGEAATPNLDRLAQDGILFTHCYNNAKCAPTRASLLTGLYCHRVGAFRSAGNIAESPAVCIAELLRESGYATIASGKWHIKPNPLDCGFQRHYGSLLAPVYFASDIDAKGGLHRDGQKVAAPVGPNWYSTIAYTDFAIEALKSDALDKGRPFFLYLAYHAPHWPLHALPQDIARYAGRFDSGTDAVRANRYQRLIQLGIVDPTRWKLPDLEPGVPHWADLAPDDQKRVAARLAVHTAMVDRMDREIGRLLAFLRDAGELDNTLLFFLSDNGACAEGGMLGDGFEEKRNRHGPVGTPQSFPAIGTIGAAAFNTPLRKYKATLYEGGSRTPLVVSWPAQLRRHRVVRTAVHAIDIAATCLAAAGARYPATWRDKTLHPLDGVSLLPLLRGAEPPARPLFWSFKRLRAMRSGRWKIVGQVAASGRKAKPWELYDLTADNSETRDRAGQHPDTVADLAQQWQRWNEDVGAVRGYEAYAARQRQRK